MTEQPPGDAEREPVGSLAEEAAKLFGALSGWAGQASDGAREEATGQAAGLADMWHDLDAHIAGEDCRYCPLCQAIRLFRQTSPEVRAHLGSAAASLMRAAAGLMRPPTGGGAHPDGVQHIDLDDAADGPDSGGHTADPTGST